MADPGFASLSTIAAPQIAASTIATAILTPILTAYIAKRKKSTVDIKSKSDEGIAKEKLVIVSDDFTGSNDTGVMFSKRDLRSIIITDKDYISKLLEDFDVLIVETP